MTREELDGYCRQYLLDKILTYAEYCSRGLNNDNLGKYVKEHIIPIPKTELVVGQEYPGHCRNANKAIWDGKKFHYTRIKFGDVFEQTINHYEDDNEEGIDVFVPIKEI
jgi:hypothetical protein